MNLARKMQRQSATFKSKSLRKGTPFRRHRLVMGRSVHTTKNRSTAP